MACKNINKNFKTSEASTKAWMRTRDLIDEYLNILDTNGFRKANLKWSKHAQKEYDTKGLLFKEENNKAFPVKENFRKIDEYKGITYEQRDPNVNYELKSVNILSSDKAKKMFAKGEKHNWSLKKILTELQIPKLHKNIILDKDITDREEIISSLLANNAFTVQTKVAVKNAKTSNRVSGFRNENVDLDSLHVEGESRGDYLIKDKNGNSLTPLYYKTKEEAQAVIDSIGKEPTQLYANLTVPGGTNYTENRILTPEIEPSIKGHAAFAEDNDIGWFRSDTKIDNPSESQQKARERAIEFEEFLPFDSSGFEDTSSNTRRILEFQSDLFQKGRGSKYLTDDSRDAIEEPLRFGNRKGAIQENQFLQLLNKKNNWVTFFIESIIQDSVKKGYEKVLFPKGDTAAKIEGHQTLEGFKKEKERRIKELESRGKEYYENEYDAASLSLPEEISESDYINSKIQERNNEIEQLKQELADVESGQTQLSSISNFYETTVTNILKKNGYNPVEITDEYGNKWNSVDISDMNVSEPIYLQKDNQQETIEISEFEQQRQQIEAALGFNIVYDKNAESHSVQGNTITVNPDKIFRDTLIHEIAHIMIDSIGGLSNPMVRKGIANLEHTALASEIRERYSDQPEDIIKKEILATAIGREGADIFGERKDRISKWERWLQLFFNRIKQVLGIERNIAKELAQEILYDGKSYQATGNQVYQQRDNTTKQDREKQKKSTIDRIISNMKAEMNDLENKQPEGWEDSYEKLNNLVTHLRNEHEETSIRQYIDIGTEVIDDIEAELAKENLSVKRLQQLKDRISPYENVEELKNRLDDYEIQNESKDVLFEKGSILMSKIERAKDSINRLAIENMAKKLSTSENGRIHQQKQEQYRDEFDEQNTTGGFLGIGSKRTINGEKVSKGIYISKRTQYVQNKMEQNREAIEKEEQQYLLETLRATPNDIGLIETWTYDAGIINDEIIQILVEMISDSESKVRTNYYQQERRAKDIHDRFIEKHGNQVNQKEKWDFILADELDENGNSTGDKVAYLNTGEYNPSFITHKNRIKQAWKDAEQERKDIRRKYVENNEKYKDQYKQAKKKEERLKKRWKKWRSENTEKVNGKWQPTAKWKNKKQDLSDQQKEMRDLILDLTKMSEKDYSSGGKLIFSDFHIGEYIRIPNVPKGTLEKWTQDGIFNNAWESFQQLYSPKEDDFNYSSISQPTAYSRDGKLHYNIPVRYRNTAQDQSFDVLTALLMDYHSSENYRQKRSIEYEVKALQDMQKNRFVDETKSNLGKGFSKIINKFSENEEAVKQDSSEKLSRRLKVTNSLINKTLYGVAREGDEKVNKLADSLVNYTSLAILPFNIFSAVSNVTMGKATSLIEAFGDNTNFSTADLRFAEKFYARHLPETMADLANTKNETILNKIMEMYDVKGDYFGPSLRFAQDGLGKQYFNSSLMYLFQSAPEHYIQGTHAIATLHSMKLQDKDNNYLNKEGEVVEDRTKAATMLDYLALGEDTEIKTNEIPNVAKTDQFSERIGTEKFHNLTKNYIRDSIAQTQGQYDSKTFSMLEKYWYGRMFENMRGWMFRGLDRNWRGASYAFSDEIPEHIKLRTRAGGADNIGYQTQFVNHVWNSSKLTMKWIRGMEKEGQKLTYDIVKQQWTDLTSSEKSRIRKAIANHAMATVAFVGSYVLLNMESDDEELPDEIIYLAYALTRAQQELWFYSNPTQTFKILKSPAASVSMLRSAGKLLTQLSSDAFNGEMERYERTRFAGRTKAGKQIQDMLPAFSQLNRDARSTLEFIKSYSTSN